MAEMVEEYYRGLFTISNLTNISEVLNAVEHVVTDGMRQSLLLPYLEDEVRVALFQMHFSKSPGSDGMSLYFFQKFWHIVDPNATSIVISVLHSGQCLHKMNYTHNRAHTKVKDSKGHH